MQDDFEHAALRKANEARLTEKSSEPEHESVPDRVRNDLNPGDMVSNDRYKVIAFLGQGAAGSVFSVEQVFLKKRFALKMLNTACTETTLRRFQKEVEAASKLDHPNLVRAIDFGLLENDRPFMIMDFVDGITLSDYLKKHGAMSLEEMLKIFIPIADALAYSHNESVIHRDIKPSNIMLQTKPQGFTPKIVDFGIARIVSEAGLTLTQTNDVFGTPLYMSPEQCVSARVDQRSDIYSLGCVIFEALTGAPPFRGESSLSTMMQHKNDLPPSLTEASLGLKFSRILETMVAKMLAKDPDLRYQSCAEVSQKLKQIEQGVEDSDQNAGTAASQTIIHSRTNLRRGTLIGSVLGSIILVILVATIPKSSRLAKSTVLPPIKAAPVANPQPVELTASPAVGRFARTPDLAVRELDKLPIHVENGIRYMDFPNQITFGTLFWWDKDGFHTVEAQKKVQIPASVKPVLKLGRSVLYENASALADLHDGDLYGVVIKQQRTDMIILGGGKELNSHILSNLAPLETLRLLEIEKMHLRPKDYKYLGAMSHLRWLKLNQAADPLKLAKLSFVSNLRLLTLDKLPNVDKILPHLSPVNLNSLFIVSCKLTDADLSAIANLHGLSTLAFKGDCAIDDVLHTLHQLQPLHRLSRLSLNINRVKIDQGQKLVSALNALNLKTLVIQESGDIPETFKDEIRHGLKGCKVIFADGTYVEPAPSSWFDFSKTDPATLDVW